MAQVLDTSKHLQEIRETWQGRVLTGTTGDMNAVVMSMLAHSFDEAMPVLLTAVYGRIGIELPGLCSAGRINKAGRIVADLALRDGRIVKDHRIFMSERAMRDVLRRLADKLKLDDGDRLQFFICARKWVVADRRLDPNMDPRDPDAKRLAVH